MSKWKKSVGREQSLHLMAKSSSSQQSTNRVPQVLVNKYYGKATQPYSMAKSSENTAVAGESTTESGNSESQQGIAN